MNVAGILDSLNDVKKILREAELYKETNRTRKLSLDIGKFSEEFLKLSQKKDYEKLYKTAMRNMDYDFLLKDDSFLQFSCVLSNSKLDEGSIRYAYYQNPRNYVTYEEFLEDNGFSYEECGEELRFEYEQEIAEARLKTSVTPIRYDYDYKLYEAIHHPISHMHIGHNNDVRIGISKVLTPAKFVSFVLRNTYRKQWKKTFQHNNVFQDLCISSKSSCYALDVNTFKKEEQEFLYMS